MSAPTSDDREPQPLPEVQAFEEWDFASLESDRARNPEYNERRLHTRRKLAALAKRARVELASLGLALEPRTSLHHPHAFNGMRVTRLWSYMVRAKPEKTRLRRVLGAELGKDLDAAYRNAYLCIAIEAEALEVSLRIHADAWFDGQNLVRRLAAEGRRPWLALLNQLDGFQLRLHDWKGEWRCGAIAPEWLDEYLKHYVPGEHMLAIERRWPLPKAAGPARAAALDAETPARLLAELARLVPAYRYAAWSAESDFLFAK
jgi:hypothetical protein